MKKIIDYSIQEESEKAYRIYTDFKDIFENLFEEPNPIPIKYLLSLKYKMELRYRLPLINPSESLISKMNLNYKEDEICELY